MMQKKKRTKKKKERDRDKSVPTTNCKSMGRQHCFVFKETIAFLAIGSFIL